MYVFYTTEDKAMRPNGNVHWFYAARLVECMQQRKGISAPIKTTVRGFNDQWDEATKQTIYKHYVPYCRLSRQLIRNITYFEDNGAARGMTREASVEYLKKILEGLGINGTQHGEPVNEPWEDRVAYDVWVSWAIGTICDWPENLFQGISRGDRNGTNVDVPVEETTSPALRARVAEAAERLRYWIRDLSIEVDIGDPPARAYEEYIPGEDEWFLP